MHSDLDKLNKRAQIVKLHKGGRCNHYNSSRVFYYFKIRIKNQFLSRILKILLKKN